MNRQRRLRRLRESCWQFFCLIAPPLVICMIFSAAALPLAEPFATWTEYFGGWLGMTGFLVAIAAIPVGIVSYVVSSPKRRVLAAAIGGLRWAWAAMPLIAGWCVARLLLASFRPGFDGTIYSGKLPAAWEEPLEWLALDMNGIVINGLALATVVYDASRRLRSVPPLVDRQCDSCGYSLRGLTTYTCPECGDRCLPETRLQEFQTTSR